MQSFVPVIDPLQEPFWDSLVAEHPGGGFFHGSAWARVLHETYGHSPNYFCRFENGQLAEMLPIMEVCSPWTGRRGVSLPFTDFCLPLRNKGHDLGALYEQALKLGRARRWRYLQCRGCSEGWQGASPSLAFYGHAIDISKPEGALFKTLGGAVRRNIRRSEAAQLRIEFLSSMEAIRIFYKLHCQTRRRHGLPPQPLRFFENIARYVLEKDLGFVGIVRLAKQPIAAAVFFHMGREAFYKFGASDFCFQHLRPNDLLMWKAIQHCVWLGCNHLDLGRTSLSNQGLRRFKLGFAAREERIEYYTYDLNARDFVADVDHAQGWFNHFFRLLPPSLLRLAGEMLYPHLT